MLQLNDPAYQEMRFNQEKRLADKWRSVATRLGLDPENLTPSEVSICFMKAGVEIQASWNPGLNDEQIAQIGREAIQKIASEISIAHKNLELARKLIQ